MLRLLAFDLSRLLRPHRGGLYVAYASSLRKLPREVRREFGLVGDLVLTRSIAETERHLSMRRGRDAERLLRLLSRISRSRGFPAVRWSDEDGD